MPRAAADKLAQGTRRVVPNLHKLITGTPAALSYMGTYQFGPNPAAGSYSGVALTKTQVTGGDSPSHTGGIVTVRDPTAPNQQFLTKSSLRNLVAAGTGRIYLLDLLTYYPGITTNVTTGAQTMLSSASGTDQRPRTGNRTTVCYAEVTTALGATPANLTLAYTRTGDLTGSRSTGAQALTTSAIAGQLPLSAGFIPLQAGDEGVASIQTATVSALMGAGVITLALADIITWLDISTDTIPADKDHADNAHALIEIPTGAALTYVWQPISATASQRLLLAHEFSECDLDAA